MTDLTQAMRNIARALEIHFLENDEARIGPARFLGATLWDRLPALWRGRLCARP